MTIVFGVVVTSYVATSFVALDSGDMDWKDVFMADTTLLTSASLSFKDMTVMPVVTFTMKTPHIYLNSSSNSFRKNIFVAVLQDKVMEDGNKTATFE